MGPITISSKSLFEGELSIEVPYYSNPFNIGDTLKYVVQVSDTDDNLSNKAEMIKIFPFTNN
ncbi:MAG: hypothetical protein K9H58_16275 [Bacteroidales bacterium]|nr:hypothetical protein [Bacteroidales bacterium]